MKIENGIFTGTFDEFLKYVLSKHGDEIIEDMTEKEEIVNTTLGFSRKEVFKNIQDRISEQIKKK